MDEQIERLTVAILYIVFVILCIVGYLLLEQIQ
jgi:hypothetical protein